MDCRKKSKEACKASRKCTYASGKKKSYCKKKNTTKSLCRKKSETKCKRVRGCKFASGTKRQFCRKNVTKRRKKTMKGGVEMTKTELMLNERIKKNTTDIDSHNERIDENKRRVDISLQNNRAAVDRIEALEGRMDELA
tara:strand:- start:103 stop:519 length:417 start_codon:yes stop_codon:yes gene_type:complete